MAVRRGLWMPRAVMVAVVLVVLCAVGLSLVGCASDGGGRRGEGDAEQRALPTYAEAAARYNERLAEVDEFFATGVVALAFIDENGEARRETGEATLQLVAPDKLALSLSKAGQRAMWFGFDRERYWRIELLDEKVAYVGRHGGRAQRESVGDLIGIDLPKLVSVLGLTRLEVDDGVVGATQWSDDGRLLGISVRRQGAVGGGDLIERVWVEPGTYLPRQIEVFEVAGVGAGGEGGARAILVSGLDEDDRIELSSGRFRPLSPTRIVVSAPGREVSIRLRLGTMRNGPVSRDAVDLSRLLDRLGVGTVVDVDASMAGG